MKPVPFAELLQPVAEAALAGVAASDSIRAGFQRDLTRRLARVLAPSLYQRFVAHRMSAQLFHGTTEGSYRSFVENGLGRGHTALLGELPLAAEAMGTLCRHARLFVEDFQAHFAADRSAIVTVPGAPGDLTIAEVTPGLSDPHRGGRSVVRVTFTDGGTLYYKPRSLAVDAVWGRGLDTINARLPLGLHASVVVDGGDHGWAQAIAEDRVMSQRKADAFYWRYGVLLGLAWLLDAVDLHRENVVIAGEHPVLVDLETLMHPRDDGEPFPLVRTGILPYRGNGIDVSCLGVSGAQIGPPVPRWKGVGTDDLHLSWQPALYPAATHLPLVDGILCDGPGAWTTVRAGFEALAARAPSERAFFETWRGELSAVERRRIYCDTEDYGWLLMDLARPAALESAAARDAKLATWQQAGASPAHILDSEREQLAVWDIPIFRVGLEDSPASPPLKELADFRWDVPNRGATPDATPSPRLQQ